MQHVNLNFYNGRLRFFVFKIECFAVNFIICGQFNVPLCYKSDTFALKKNRMNKNKQFQLENNFTNSTLSFHS